MGLVLNRRASGFFASSEVGLRALCWSVILVGCRVGLTPCVSSAYSDVWPAGSSEVSEVRDGGVGSSWHCHSLPVGHVFGQVSPLCC